MLAVELTRTIVKCENELGELARPNNFCRLNKSKKFKYLICLYIFRLRNYNCNVLHCPLDSDESLCVTRPVTRGGGRGDGRWGIQSLGIRKFHLGTFWGTFFLSDSFVECRV